MSNIPTQLGPYAIDRELGRGGMGVVYLGRDTKLDRPIAIKALPEDFAANPDRLARFEREARTLASLNHPNVAGIHGLEEHDGAKYLILEYVEGETLADRLDRGPMPVDDALEIASQIAAGVEAAHEQGVIHRDLKPGNVIVTPEGNAKVLDFGLARVEETSSSSVGMSQDPTITSPTIQHSPTIPGAILGTAAYMSPEQARGRKVDKRTDIWSFGVLLYEMLTGASPFHGETVSDSIGAVLHKEVDLDRLPANTPPMVRHVLRRCLERDKAKRYRDIGDVRVEIENALTQSEWTTDSFQTVLGGTTTRWLWRATGLTALGVLVGAAIVWVVGGRFVASPNETLNPTLRFDVPIVVDNEPVAIDDLAIAPDGSAIVIAPVDDGPLIVRELDSFEVRTLTGTERAASPFFSPDGLWIAFYQQGRLMRIARDGGLPLPIADARDIDQVQGGIWLDNDEIIVIDTDNRAIIRVDVASGTVERFATLPVDQGMLGFDALCAVPGEDYVLLHAYTGNSIDAYSMLSVSLADGAMSVVAPNASCPLVASDGTLIYLRDSSLFAVPFDFDRVQVTGPERRVLDGVAASQWGDAAKAAMSWSGTLVYLPGERLSNGRRVVRVDRQGKIEPITEPDALGAMLAVSPDGSSIVMNTLRRALETWIYDIERSSMRRILSEGESYNFVWESNGKRLAYNQQRPERGYSDQDIVVRDLESGGGPQVVATLRATTVADWLPDGSGLLLLRTTLAEPGSPMRTQLQMLRLDAPESVAPLFDQEGYSITKARFSPDGRWLAYLSDEPGQTEVYLRRYPELDRAWLVSSSEGKSVIWAPDSGALYWGANDRMMKATIQEAEGRVIVGAPSDVFASPWPRAASRWNAWTMGPDGRFVAIEPAKWEQEPGPMRVILNWDQELSQSP